MKNTLLLTACACFMAMSIEADDFEAVSIRPAAPLQREELRSAQNGQIAGRTISLRYRSVRELVALAYGVEETQVIEQAVLPRAPFDIRAVMPGGAVRQDIPKMLQPVLLERFGVKLHIEERAADVYWVEQAGTGIRAQRAPAPDSGDDERSVTTRKSPRISPMGRAPSDGIRQEWDAITITEFCQYISPMLDAPALDRTGLNEYFRIGIVVSLQDEINRGVKRGQLRPDAVVITDDSDPNSGSLLESIKKLGLVLKKGRTAMKFVVVDSANSQPTEN